MINYTTIIPNFSTPVVELNVNTLLQGQVTDHAFRIHSQHRFP